MGTPSAADTAPPGTGVLQVVLTLGAGGTERLVVQLCQRLRTRFRLAVCTLDEPGLWSADLNAAGIDIIPLARRPGFHPTVGYQIAQVARARGAKLLHCHHYSPFVYGAIATLARPGLRLVFTEHGRLSDGPPSPKRRMANHVLGRLPGEHFAVSQALKDSMVAEGFPGNRIAVVPNGIDAGPVPDERDRRQARQLLGLPDNAFIVGTVARLDPVKDLSMLIAAFARLRATHPHSTLLIVGDGPERSRLEGLSREHGVASDVRMTGQRDDARELLSAFDVYVNSSTSEGVSLSILEAMAARLPVVATRVGGTPEVVVHGRTGLLVPARDPHALAQALRMLADDIHQRQMLGESARVAVEERFTLDRMVDHYARVYARLAG
ncbi:MAG: glycosyltransferase [Acidobacteriota bacterium]|nr:glycosyltransferase [Acidobacteriota bacterium]